MMNLRTVLILIGAGAATVSTIFSFFALTICAAIAGLSALLILAVLFACKKSLHKENWVVDEQSSALRFHPPTRPWYSRTGWLVALLMVCTGFGCWSLFLWLGEYESYGGGAAAAAAAVGASLGYGFFALIVAVWASSWLLVEWLAQIDSRNRMVNRLLGILIPVLFGVGLLVLWELFTRSLEVPKVLLPPPSDIAARFASSTSILWADFKQTFLKAVLIGYAMGCLSGLIVAIVIDRSPFLQRGLLPVGNMVAALPIVGIAPIMVMWFGFDWPSKAAVVVVMTFFPMLVNTLSGLAAHDHIQQDLMKTYAAGYWQNLVKLRLPLAMPFIFNALKINSTLALIGAIVAEFFGTPIVGMGFRISTEVGRMNVDMVWAEIAVAALAGSCFYGLLTLIERWVTFWHPSVRAA